MDKDSVRKNISRIDIECASMIEYLENEVQRELTREEKYLVSMAFVKGAMMMLEDCKQLIGCVK